MFLQVENPERQALYLSKTNSFLIGKECARNLWF
jgi:hypothetical protein